MKRVLAILVCLTMGLGGLILSPASVAMATGDDVVLHENVESGKTRIGSTENECIEMKLAFPENVGGALAVYDILFTMDNTFRFQAGDQLEYDVWVSHDVAGVGGLDLCFGYEPNQILRGNGIDANGVGSHPASDLSDYAYGKWYHRSIQVSDNFVTNLPEGVGPAVVFAADIPSCAELAGQTVIVRYDNIRITRSGEAVQKIYPGQNTVLPESPVSYVSVNPGAAVSYQLVNVAVEGGSGEGTGGESGEGSGGQNGEGTSGEGTSGEIGNGSEKEANAADKLVEMTLTFSQNASGAAAIYDILFTMDYNFRFQKGDKLEYDVWFSDDVAGIGGLDLCFGYEPDQILRGNGIDDKGVGSHPASDLSDYAHKKWYHRSIKVTDNFITKLPEGVGPAVIFAVDMASCKELAGKTITIRYANIRITRDGQTIQDIFPGQNPTLPETPTSYVSVNPGVTVHYALKEEANIIPKTGDSVTVLPVVLLIVSGMALVALLCQRRRQLEL